jgi:hypothetical protein
MRDDPEDPEQVIVTIELERNTEGVHAPTK